MPILGSPAQRKAQVFREFQRGALHSGPGGKLVTDRKQAIAIALSEARPKKRKRTLLSRARPVSEEAYGSDGTASGV